ncbi:MAG: Rpn family recombination-promoting nuclease/putative transposase [Lachnospiraceae bacterium]|nr:Rpn family recombination-promoting nuclease/putative transposase [Lachnospiraceae bacterium]
MGLDLSEKILVDYNDVFADIMNVFLYDGKRVIKEEQLENSKDVTQYKADGKLHEQERDVSKFYNGKEMRIAFLGIENQNNEDPYMPLRVISYDGSAYRAQLLSNNHRKKQKPYPVITLVLYFGTKPWSAGKSLYEVLEIPEDLKKYVNDYTINLVEVAFLEQEQIDLLQSDFKILADFLVKKRKDDDFIPNYPAKHIDVLLKMMDLLSKDKCYLEILEELKETHDLEKEKEINMCEVYDKIFQKGVQQEKANTEKERERADSEKKRADSEKKRADSEKKRADSECKRADKAEKELEKIQKMIKGKNSLCKKGLH